LHASGEPHPQVSDTANGDPAGTRNRFTGTADAVMQAGQVCGDVHINRPGGSLLPTPRQLPADIANFTGRTTHLDRLDALLTPAEGGPPTTVVLSTIAGTAGVGKTALAVHWAHLMRDHFPDGDLYADLRGYAPGPPAATEEVLEGFLRALDVPGEKIPHTLPAQAALYRSLLNGRRMLVVLDNAVRPEQVRPLLPASPGCLVVVTSRNRLSGLVINDGACAFTLDPMSPAEAVALLGRTVGAARADRDPKAVAELAQRCGYLPLALLITAERAVTRPDVTLADLVAELTIEHERLDMLTVDDDETVAVRAAFSWSYRALAPAAARLFRLLGLHAGSSISVFAAAALADTTPHRARRLLDVLAGVHLLERVGRERYQLHDLLRLYAAERAADEESDEARHEAVLRVLDWYLHTGCAALLIVRPPTAPKLTDPPRLARHPLSFTDRAEALDWYELEYANVMAAIRQAVEIGQDPIAWRLVTSYSYFFILRKGYAEWVRATRMGLAAARRVGDKYGEAQMLTMLGFVLCDLRQFDEALDMFRESLAIYSESGDEQGRGIALNNVGFALRQLRRFDEAIDYLQQCQDHSRARGDRLAEGYALNNLGEALRMAGRPADAVGYLHEALAIRRETCDPWAEGFALDNLANTYQDLRNLDIAVDYFQQALELRRELTDPWGEARSLRGLGNVHYELGNVDTARELWQRSFLIFSDLGDRQALEIRDSLAMAGPKP
jgi:tetratricopeptide (TPR) repeat protein